jgi:carotenoid cleavage dioxygenase-like enzyme
MTEDDELFAIYSMGYPYENIETLVSKGLHYDKDALFSTDFVVVDRLKPEGCHWKPRWFDTDGVFFWHTGCAQWQKEKVMEISKMTMDKVEEARQDGWNPFDTIRTKD